MSEPFDASKLRGWMQQVEYWLSDYEPGADRQVEALQMARASLSMLIHTAEELRESVCERLGVK